MNSYYRSVVVVSVYYRVGVIVNTVQITSSDIILTRHMVTTLVTWSHGHTGHQMWTCVRNQTPVQIVIHWNFVASEDDTNLDDLVKNGLKVNIDCWTPDLQVKNYFQMEMQMYNGSLCEKGNLVKRSFISEGWHDISRNLLPSV